jgi:FKBP-type peptidyl-prolyl cis-trans isomerase (trigger factor)
MKVETKKLDATKVQLDIEVEQDALKKKFDEVYEKVSKEAKIPGFRPGKAPRDIVEKYHGRLVREEVIKQLIPEAYKGSLEVEKISALDMPQISEVKLESNTLSFKAVVEVRPDINIKDYKDIKLKVKKIAVVQDEVEKALQNLKEAHKAKDIDEKFARSLGYATVDIMRLSIERQLWAQKENDQRYHLQDALLKDVLAKVNFRIPPSLIQRRQDELVYEAKMQLLRRGATQEQIRAKEEDLKKELCPEAENQVKTYLVLEEIAKRESIPCDNHMSQKVIEFLLSEANWMNES